MKNEQSRKCQKDKCEKRKIGRWLKIKKKEWSNKREKKESLQREKVKSELP